MRQHPPSTVQETIPEDESELQKSLEVDRGWIRQQNSKLYDPKLTRLVQNSSNGSVILKAEIQNSVGRLNSVKQGALISSVVSQREADFYVPDIESYFSTSQRLIRNKAKNN